MEKLGIQTDNTVEGENSYISYFQSVITIGVVNQAKSVNEATKKAKKRFKQEWGNGFSCGIVGQTPFEISETELCNPELTHIKI